MKKFFSLGLCLMMICSVLFIGGCSKKPSALKFGAGVYVSSPAVTDASADSEGTGKIDITVAAVSVDADGKIVACAIDTISNSVKYDAEGKAIANDGFKTKYERGSDYGMVAYGGSAKEWFEQVDAFETVVAGKTLDEVRALVAEGNKGNSDVINAGCTIEIDEFVAAVEKAYNAAAESDVTANDTIKVTAATEQTCTDATEEKNGSNKVSTYVFAAALNAEGKVVAASSDCVDVSFTFDTKGVSAFDASKAVISKKEQGSNYGMVAYGGSAKEWFEQAAAFDAACIGKTANEISGLIADDNKGVKDLQDAGCTIDISGFVKAASKI